MRTKMRPPRVAFMPGDCPATGEPAPVKDRKIDVEPCPVCFQLVPLADGRFAAHKAETRRVEVPLACGCIVLGARILRHCPEAAELRRRANQFTDGSLGPLRRVLRDNDPIKADASAAAAELARHYSGERVPEAVK